MKWKNGTSNNFKQTHLWYFLLNLRYKLLTDLPIKGYVSLIHENFLYININFIENIQFNIHSFPLPRVSHGESLWAQMSRPVSRIAWSCCRWRRPPITACHWQKLFNVLSAWWVMWSPGYNKQECILKRE